MLNLPFEFIFKMQPPFVPQVMIPKNLPSLPIIMPAGDNVPVTPSYDIVVVKIPLGFILSSNPLIVPYK